MTKPMRPWWICTLDLILTLSVIVWPLWWAILSAPVAQDRSPRLVVVAIDGLSWPILTPLISANEAPTLARLASACRGSLISEPGQSPGLFWERVVRVRPPGILDASSGRPLSGLTIWETLSRSGDRVAMVDWPSAPGTTILSGGKTECPAPSAEPPLPAGDERSSVLEARQDQRGVTTALWTVARQAPVAVFLGLSVLHDALLSPRPELKRPFMAGYARALDAELARLLDGLSADSTVIVLGRGLGSVGSPGENGVFLGRGPGLSGGPLEGPVRDVEVGPTLVRLCSRPLPLGTQAAPCRFVLKTSETGILTMDWEPRP